jgi:DNA polymerase I-like protein with 3'-5' exonuclease and polymerase domains
VQTLGGRRCRFQRQGDSYARTYKACNSVIQGSAADQGKRAVVMMRREGIIPLNIVHDDTNNSIPRGEAGVRMIGHIKDIMEAALPLSIPVVADVKVSQLGGSAMKKPTWRGIGCVGMSPK